MHIAVVNLTGGGLSGGAVKTLTRLVPHLRADPRVEALDVFVPPAAAGLEALAGQAIRTWGRGDWLCGFAGLKQRILALKPDVVFFPSSLWLRCGAIPTVIMVRNMEAVQVPIGGNAPLAAMKNLLRARLFRRGCRKATRIIAVSQYVRDFLVESWRLPAERIGVAHHGVDAPLPPEQMARPALAPAGGVPFWFTAGSIIPYRGLEDAIRALGLRAERDEQLWIAGEAIDSPAYRNRMQVLARQCDVADRVVWLGRLRPAEMGWCYHHCRAFVMTSRLEACPNVALEAMAHGCAIVSTDNPPMPEMFGASGETAEFYPAGTAEALAERLVAMAEWTPETRAERCEAARRRAAQFSWPAAAQKTVDELQRAISAQRR